MWDDENNCWWFSATDIVRAINNEPEYTKASNYWRWLKRKLKQQGVELVSATHGFKFEAPDGKLRVADVLDSEGVALLAKNYPNNRANEFLDWSQIDKNEYLAAMCESIADSTQIKALVKPALTTKIDDREMFMKGICRCTAGDGQHPVGTSHSLH